MADLNSPMGYCRRMASCGRSVRPATIVAPGQRFETIVEVTEPGIWAFHCHILNRAESGHGMVGMVTALIIEE